MTPISDDEIAALVDAADKATPGPWLITETESSVAYEPIVNDADGDADGDGDRTYLTGWQDICAEGDSAPIVIVTGFRNDLTMSETPVDDNAAFIALANPTTIRALASRVQSDAAVIAGLREEANGLSVACLDELERDAKDQFEAHHEWLLENPEQPDTSPDAVDLSPGTLLKLIAVVRAALALPVLGGTE